MKSTSRAGGQITTKLKQLVKKPTKTVSWGQGRLKMAWKPYFGDRGRNMVIQHLVNMRSHVKQGGVLIDTKQSLQNILAAVNQPSSLTFMDTTRLTTYGFISAWRHTINSNRSSLRAVFEEDRGISLSNIPPHLIFKSSISIQLDTLQDQGQLIEYKNGKIGGYSSNIRLQFKNQLGNVFDAENRISEIQRYLKNNGIELNADQISEMTVIQLVEKIASELIKDINVSSSQKALEEKLEKMIQKITRLLVNETDITNTYYPIVMQSGTKVTGSNYMNFWKYSNLVMPYHEISTDQIIERGAADCRGTNCIYATLLNVGYKAIGSEKEARVLYTLFEAAPSNWLLTGSQGEDHNVVLVSDSKSHVMLFDAYNPGVNGIPLSLAIQGTQSQESYCFQINAACDYPPQQNRAKLKEYSETIGQSNEDKRPSFLSSLFTDVSTQRDTSDATVESDVCQLPSASFDFKPNG